MFNHLSIYPLILFIFTSRLKAQESLSEEPQCETLCPFYVIEQRICASDGDLYIDICRAYCLDRSLAQLSPCPSQDWENCAATCRYRVYNNCMNLCPNYESPQKICASDGKLYTDICRARCENSNNNELFACENNGRCNNECLEAAATHITKLTSEPIILCASECPLYVRFQLQCFSDGNLYTDNCYADCVNSSLRFRFDCGYPVRATACYEQCVRDNAEAE